MSKKTDIHEFLGELDAGIFADKLSHEISQTALAVVEHGAAGKIQITIDMKQLGNHSQINCTHKMAVTKPTKRGKKTEEDTTQTPMHVGKGGYCSVFPENQMDLLEQQSSGQSPQHSE